MRRTLLAMLLFAVAAVAIIEGRSWYERNHHQFPWTELDLNQPVGRFTASKIAALGTDAPQCRALLQEAGARDVAAPAVGGGNQCGYTDGIRLRPEGTRSAGFAPSGLVTSCPVAAALLLWDERVVQPAALRHLGSQVASFQHAGSYSCRRLYGRASGAWSEHATADAVDIMGFRLADGQTVSVLRDWSDNGPQGAFLREVRDGGCRLFTTVLSPDYNAAHRDHLHLDTAYRGLGGWRACR